MKKTNKKTKFRNIEKFSMEKITVYRTVFEKKVESKGFFKG